MKKKVTIFIALVLVCGLGVLGGLLITHVICPFHDWQAATCTEPETCSKCGRTQGEPLGHTWQEATCIEPHTCSICGATQGSALGHNWNDATCTEPKTCVACGTIEGSALGHDWKDATCTEPKTCSQCNKTEGDPLGHFPGEWEKEDVDMVSATFWRKQYCTVCHELLDLELGGLSSFAENGVFLITPQDFTERLELSLGLIHGCDMTTGIRTLDDGSAMCVIWDAGKMIATLEFLRNGDSFSEDDVDTAEMTGMLGYCTGGNTEAVAQLLVGLTIACDPALEFEDAKDVASNILDANTYAKNGVLYGFSSYDDGYAIMVSIQ